MMRFGLPAIFIGLSIAIFFVFVTPVYTQITDLKTELGSYDSALNNSKSLENERDKLTAKSNSIEKDSIVRLQKLLPDNIDNIRLILELEQVAVPYGITLKNVKYDTTPSEKIPANAGISQGSVVNGSVSNAEYGTWNLEFSINSSYDNFLNFTRDLEKNLRIVDVASIDFSSNVTNSNVSATASDPYQYNFKIKTYWLKN